MFVNNLSSLQRHRSQLNSTKQMQFHFSSFIEKLDNWPVSKFIYVYCICPTIICFMEESFKYHDTQLFKTEHLISHYLKQIDQP